MLYQKKRSNVVKNIFISLVGIMLVAFLLNTSGYRIASTIGVSMEPTIHYGSKVVIDTNWYQFNEVQRGDILSFLPPHDRTSAYIKRVIGLPGDTLVINNATVTINGITLSEPYVASDLQGNPNQQKYQQVVLPSNCYYVLGDDRFVSYDSRSFGCVPRANILGKIVLVLGEPLLNIKLLPDESTTYNQLPS